jgi:AAA domain-containing protein
MKTTKPTILAPNARQIVRNLLVLKTGEVLAGYRIGPERWDFTGRDRKIQRMNVSTDVWAALTGRTVHERVSTRPAPVVAWARNLDKRTPDPLPDIHTCGQTLPKGDLLLGLCGCETWNTHLVRMQERIASIGMDDKVVFRYFGVGRVPRGYDLRKRLLDGGKPHKHLAEILADEARVNDIVSGWRGTVRMNEREQAWVRKRSLAPGVTASRIATDGFDGWDDLAIGALAGDVEWEEDPFGRAVTVHTWVDGVKHTSAVRCLMLARVQEMEYPDNGAQPWMTYADRATDAEGRPFPVEWSLQGTLRKAEDLAAEVDLDLRKAMNLKRDYQKHNEVPPEQVDRAIAVARETRDQVTGGRAAESTRLDGTVTAIITGTARGDKNALEVVEERAAALSRLYVGGVLKQEYTGAYLIQSAALRSVTPGEPRDKVAYQRRFRLPFLSAAMPNVSVSVGDQRGPYMGFTKGATRRAFHHDPFFATEGQTTGRGQNMHAYVATLGGGKSMIIGLVAYQCVRRNIRTIISDPSGPLAKLTTLPELAPFSQVIDLGKGASGILSPASLIRDPNPTDYLEEDPGLYAEMRTEAQAERRGLTVDMADRCLDSSLHGTPETVRALNDAARLYSQTRTWETTTTLWDLVDALNALNEPHARHVAAALEDASTMPLMRLMFPPRGQDLPPRDAYDKVLTVITMPGVSRPKEGLERKDWNPREMGADAVLRLIGLYTDRLIFSKQRYERAAVFYDEAEMITDTSAGRGLFSRLGRDHSKWNLYVGMAFKSIDQQMMSGELRNFIASVFAGKMANAEPAMSALTLLGLDDPSYAQTLMNLSEVQAGEFVHLDVAGEIGSVKIDVEFHAPLLAALKTDPGAENAADWILDLEDSL